ncbi:UDP-N-acetylmuramate dehydrogenase [Cytobacillus solani]|uniref:UDP-N-acetylenolpyruvoylglucosamine reductase n=1 Tax=Cytobacillus solani TaxID=1637975 RepID=A0A0Q3T9A3_9BACI|nr:UDP-N-acetylmuramate dehydrogenase [Cytobacillus solani]KQL19965.1 UDP-N-acetylenolpyruvoylglucosamine reductase [Cytobacillus solani]USK53209.1 UDP-N-acetylmuramate dehydrogenase [Cytobacillus solani]
MSEYQLFMNSISDEVMEENIKLLEPIKHHTFTKLGGEADLFITPSSLSEIKTVLKQAKKFKIPVTILGSGSNVIVRDGGIRGITLCLSKFNHISIKNDVITAQSGAAIIAVSSFALEHELTGLEFACGIPGSVGGALYMNAGAYGGQISDVLDKATALTRDGEILTLSKEELQLNYRKSIFMNRDYVILEAVFQLKKGDPKWIKQKMHEFTTARKSKQPLEYPSCGSVFKRPPGHFAGKLIQDSKLQGTRVGGAEVSTKHAGFIVNIDQATSKDYIDLINVIKETVKKNFDIDLETEVIIIGEEL